jgi:hypothetical protein
VKEVSVTKKIKLGGSYLEVPDDSPLMDQASTKRALATRAEKPEEPEELDREPYIYQPNDPFRSSIYRIEALGNVKNSEKPWIRKSFFFFFVIFPLFFGELGSYAIARNEDGTIAWKLFLAMSFITLLACAPYFVIWLRARREPKSQQKSVA